MVIRSRFTVGRRAQSSSVPTLKQLGLQMGVTKERVRQIQNKAIRKLRVTLDESLTRTETSHVR